MNLIQNLKKLFQKLSLFYEGNISNNFLRFENRLHWQLGHIEHMKLIKDNINWEKYKEAVAKNVKTLIPTFLSTIPIKEGKVLCTNIPIGAIKYNCINEITSVLLCL